MKGISVSKRTASLHVGEKNHTATGHCHPKDMGCRHGVLELATHSPLGITWMVNCWEQESCVRQLTTSYIYEHVQEASTRCMHVEWNMVATACNDDTGMEESNGTSFRCYGTVCVCAYAGHTREGAGTMSCP